MWEEAACFPDNLSITVFDKPSHTRFSLLGLSCKKNRPEVFLKQKNMKKMADFIRVLKI